MIPASEAKKMAIKNLQAIYERELKETKDRILIDIETGINHGQLSISTFCRTRIYKSVEAWLVSFGYKVVSGKRYDDRENISTQEFEISWELS